MRHVKFVRWLHRQLKSDSVDLVFSMITYCNLIALLATRSLPVVISERNLATKYLPLEGLGGRLQLLAAKALYKRAAGAVAIGHVVAADLLSLGVASARVHVVPNPVLDSNHVNVRTGTSGQQDELSILFVGRLVEQKRPWLALETVAELTRSHGRGARITLVGDGVLREDLMALARELQVDADFAGWVEDWESLAASHDVLLLPSSVEGFGNVLIEAASLGLPCVVCSDALAVLDAVALGVTGEMAYESTPLALAEAVIAAAKIRVGAAAGPFLTRFTRHASTRRLTSVLSTVSFESSQRSRK